MSSSTKRRRTNSDNEDDNDIRPPAAVLSNPAPVVSAAAVVAAEPHATQIQYGSDIAKLLYGDMQKDDEQEVETAMEALSDLVDCGNADWKKNVQEAVSLGALGILLLVMRQWTQNETIQHWACDCLGCFTYGDKTTFREAKTNSVIIAKAGGVETITDAMKNFPNSLFVQVNGCCALGNIFCFDDETIIEHAMGHFVNDLNGVALTVKAMKKFQDDGDVQEHCCQLLRNVSWDDAHHHALKKARAVSAVGKAMEKHDEECVQTEALAFFKNISSDK